MSISVGWITGVNVGIELFEDDGGRCIVISLGIVRLLFEW